MFPHWPGPMFWWMANNLITNDTYDAGAAGLLNSTVPIESSRMRMSGIIPMNRPLRAYMHWSPTSIEDDLQSIISKKDFRLGGMAAWKWTRSIRAVRDTLAADCSAPGANTRRGVAYCPPTAVSLFLLALSVSFCTRTLRRCAQQWPYFRME